jgi:hypothetical protein
MGLLEWHCALVTRGRFGDRACHLPPAAGRECGGGRPRHRRPRVPGVNLVVDGGSLLSSPQVEDVLLGSIEEYEQSR